MVQKILAEVVEEDLLGWAVVCLEVAESLSFETKEDEAREEKNTVVRNTDRIILIFVFKRW